MVCEANLSRRHPIRGPIGTCFHYIRGTHPVNRERDLGGVS
jgi:hypothetical protein